MKGNIIVSKVPQSRQFRRREAFANVRLFGVALPRSLNVIGHGLTYTLQEDLSDFPLYHLATIVVLSATTVSSSQLQ
jgi:hypothetical protein